VYQEGGLDFDEALRVNAEGTGLLMAHCRKAKGALVMSSCAVYALPRIPITRSRRLTPEWPAVGALPDVCGIEDCGGSRSEVDRKAAGASHHHRADERVLRRIRRASPWQFEWMLAGMPVPVQPNRASVCSPIYEEDVYYQVGGLLAAASVPATIVNWGGDEAVDVRTYCTYMADIGGVRVQFQDAPDDPLAARTVVADGARRRELAGDCKVKWQDGMRRMIAARHPEIKLKAR